MAYFDHVYSREYIHGIELLDALCFGGFEERYEFSYDHLGDCFKDYQGFHGLKFAYERFQARYYDEDSEDYSSDSLNDESFKLDEESSSDAPLPRETKNFSDFIDYLLRNEDPNFIGTIDDLRKLGLMGDLVGIKDKIKFFESF